MNRHFMTIFGSKIDIFLSFYSVQIALLFIIHYNKHITDRLRRAIMRIVICDDDENISKYLHKCLLDFFKKSGLKGPEFAFFSCGEDLLADNGKKDIIFLDIEMPGLSGIYVGKELKKENSNAIIFVVTSYMEYLDEAMRFHVFRYLSKPIDKQRLFINMNDALRVYSSTTTKIPIETKDGVISVSANDIITIEAISRKVIIHTISGDYVSVHNMNFWTKELPDQCFFQTHRSFIVNMAHINEFGHDIIYLYNNQFTAYLTRRKYTSFKDAYLLYLESTR